MQIQMKIKQDGKEEISVVAGVADIIALEEHFDIDASTLSSRQRMVWLAFLAWSALKRNKKTTESFDEFRANLDGLELDDDSEKKE